MTGPLAVVSLLLLVLPLQGAVLKCFTRPPPQIYVVPFQPQSRGWIKDCDAHTSTCFYFRYHGSRVSRSWPVHGCMKLSDLPPACHNGANFYEPRWHLWHKGTKYEGSIKCCGTDYCNEIEEAMFVPVHFNHDEPGWFKEYLLLPIIVTAILGLIFKDYLPDVLYGVRHWLRLDEDTAEESDREGQLKMNPCKLAALPDEKDDGTGLLYTGPNVSGFFSTVQNMLEIIHEIDKWRPIDGVKEREMRREEKKGALMGKRKGGKDPNAKEISINSNICNRQASQHDNSKVFREVPTRLTDLLARLIEHGPYEFPFDPNELGCLFEMAGEILGDEPSVVEVDFDVHIIGNLEGSYIDLFRWFMIYGWPPKEKFVFLGGTIHPTMEYSLEVIAMLFALKVKMPQHIYIIRGNGEGQPLNMGERFPTRVAEALREVASDALTRLPLAALINKQILCIHSSLPNGMTTIEELNEVRRPIHHFHKESLEAHLFNAVPHEIFQTKLLKKYDQERDGVDDLAYATEVINSFRKMRRLVFLPRDLDETAKKLSLELIIRSQSVCEKGVSLLTEHVMSVYSAHFSGAAAAAGLYLDRNGIINITRLYKFGEFNREESNVAKDILEKTAERELDRAENARREGETMAHLHLREPVKERMGFGA